MAQHDDRALLLVSEAVSDALEVPIEALPPLSESINLDGLDAVVSHRDAADVTVTFSYAGLRVFVHSDGFGSVHPPWDDRAPIDGSSSSNCWVIVVDERADVDHSWNRSRFR